MQVTRRIYNEILIIFFCYLKHHIIISNFVTNYSSLSLTTNPKFQLNVNNIELKNTSINISTVLNIIERQINYKLLINEFVAPVPGE